MTLNDDSLNNENNIKIKKISYWRQYSAWSYTTLVFLVNLWLTIACYLRFEFRVRPPEILMSLFCVFLTTLFAYSLDNFEYLRIRMFDVVSVQPSYQWTMYTLFYALINIIAWSLPHLGPINICVFSRPCSEYLLDPVLSICWTMFCVNVPLVKTWQRAECLLFTDGRNWRIEELVRIIISAQ